MPEFSPRVCPPIASTLRLILLRGCVWRDYPRAGQARRLYGWAVHLPSLIKPSTYQPVRHLIRGQRAAFGSPGQWSPNTVLILGGS
jgi:hypothetical protein